MTIDIIPLDLIDPVILLGEHGWATQGTDYMPKVAYVVYNLQIRTTAYLQVMPPTLCRIGLMPCLPQPTRLAISSATTFAGILKRNGNYSRCFDKPKPPATKELAIQRYASEYPPATICAPLKLMNSSFQCTRDDAVEPFGRGCAGCVRVGGHRAGSAAEKTPEAIHDDLGKLVD